MEPQMVQQLAILHDEVKGVATSDPRLASGAEKALQGIREMQIALVRPEQPIPDRHWLVSGLEIHIPMPEGAAVPEGAER